LKRVLIITYYWPPSGGAGVQRWLKFSKYLPLHQWQPVIYTPSNPEAPVDDPSLQKDVHPETVVWRRRIWEPYMLYKSFVGMGKGDRINAGFLSEDEKPPRKEGLAVWIRGNLFIPDARKFWVDPSARFLLKNLRDNPVDAVISTGPPHSMHLIAFQLHQRMRIPWIADFRDPWTEIDFYNQLKLTRRADRKHHRLEAQVLTSADRVVVVGETMAERFRLKAGIQTSVIPNGYDDEDFTGDSAEEDEQIPGSPGHLFNVVHVGAMNRDRNHPAFWETLASLKREDPEFERELRITLVGKLDHSVHRSLAEFQLQDCTKMTPSLPHNQVIPLLRSATVLYLPINHTPNARSIATGKIFEYLSAARPILGIGPVDGDAAGILRSCKAGEMVDFTDLKEMKRILSEWALRHRQGKLAVRPTNIDRYSRRNLTGTYAEVLNQVTQNT